MSWQNLCFSWLLRRTAKSLTRKPGLTAQEMRERSAKWARGEAKPPRGWRVRKLDAQALRGEWIEPEAAERREATGRVILYLHGGGYCFCSPVTHRGVAAALAREADARAFSLDYRLAPEHPFPAAVDDALAAYQALLDEGVAADRIVIAGDSSGGGLALALLLSLRDAGAPLPAGAVLFSPWTDLAATGASLEANDASDVMLTAVAVRNFSRYYLGDAAADHPIASPLYGDYAGLPDLFIQASDTEVLLDDAARVARKASAAGVGVDFKVWRRLPHAWATLAPMLPEARAAIKEAGGFVRKVAP
ncbi:alpha/beta hydrolase [Chromobacterium haemolyticum]|uniref:Alpha/beta hydrolase n=1 Tax=Chromobacterium haemolyticum TaxID=394935 RepID=A0ABS3GP48_9NEIS|nr:alpha/beta hydrolase [Chromobacterium haemolyticum]MBK0415440.1 alpha/beta hydrolase [Chromobacterium haemolyticum]MBO0416821.1 alpha/beta hydrolase [Chromobacterium haemolyticum]MBO0499991.1 alpha/beta hydrolase [Chromobacterium haemolyticum]